MPNKPHPRLRVLHRSASALGPSKADLLEGIDELGSIAAAGRRMGMGMSYRRAWLLIDTMNHCFRKPVVDASKGGANGGGARITDFGRIVLERYRRLEQHAAREFDDLLTRPR